ncbi:MAG: helix-turn-helix domain-containing protein [Candidatus Bathyarchaeia archaeon]|jgi:sugar-specific transcriptional regulator TrmB
MLVTTLQNDKTIETLMDLGLTYLQAKTYLTLTQLEKAEAQKISKASDVARQDIYRIMPTLEKLGLAEKIIATPILYKAVPLKEGSLMLLQKRTKEHTTLQEKIKVLLNSDQERNINSMVHEEAPQFIITSERKLLVKRFEKAFLEVTTCEMIFPTVGLNFVLFNFFQSFKMAIIKSAKIRIITEKTEIGPLVSRKLQTLKKNPLFEIKFATSPIDFEIVIFNNKEVNMCISCIPSEVPSLWTNNPQVVKVARTIFEDKWNNAQDYL